MKHASHALALLAAAASLSGDGLRFAPEPGLELEKTFSETTEWRLEDFTVSVGGREVDPGDIDLTGSAGRKIVVRDLYTAVAKGRPERLVRHFDEVTSDSRVRFEQDGREERYRARCKGALAGRAVRFEWDEDQGEHRARFDDDGERDDELLEGLFEDMDLRGLLPTDEVEPGDEWTPELAAVLRLLAPGGDLVLLPESLEMPGFGFLDREDVLMVSLCQVAEAVGKIDGRAVVRLRERGEQLAVLAIELDLELSADLHERYRRMAEKLELDGARYRIDAIALELEIEGKGELVWDLAAHHLRSFELEAQVIAQFDVAAMNSSGGEDVDMEGSYEISAKTVLRAGVERD